MLDCLPYDTPHPMVFLAIALCLGLALVMAWVARQRYFSGKAMFLIALAGMIYWLCLSALENWVSGETCKLASAKAAWPGIALTPIAICFFLYDYSFGRDSLRYRWKVAVITLAPVAISVLALTNSTHWLFYRASSRLIELGERSAILFDHGPLFYAAALFLYIFQFAALAILFRGVITAQPAYRAFFLMWLSMMLVPTVVNLGYIFGGITWAGMDPTPYSFSIALLVFAWLIFNDRFFDINVIAKDLLFFGTPNAIIVLNGQTRVIASNPVAQKRLRVSPDKTGASADHWPGLGTIRVALGEGAPLPKMLPGHDRSYEVEVVPIHKPLGLTDTPLGWVIVLRDITDRLKLERSLATERDYLSQIMATSISGFLTFDTAGKFVFANAEAERVLGQTSAQMTARRHDDPAWNFESPEGLPIDPADLPTTQVLETGQSVRDVRLGVRRPDGELRYLSINAASVSHKDGAAGIVCALSDITSALADAEELELARDRAEDANRTKSQFLANMSHELRTPLNGVLGLASALEGKLEDPELQRLAATIRESGDELLNILNDILDMSKIEAGKLVLDKVAFVPADLVARADALHGLRAAEKGLSLTMHADEGSTTPRLGDPHRLLQILHNLISNAVKFTEVGSVTVRVTATSDSLLVIDVADTGIGMQPEQIARLYNEFEQGDGSVARRFGGTGLGMAITRKLVGQMAGEIDVHSIPGQGSRFTVRLPLPTATGHEREQNVDAQGAHRQAMLAPLRLLAADDNHTNRVVLDALLRRAVSRLTLVKDGFEACAAWMPGQFDVVLLDISMPGMDGFAALKTLQERANAAGVAPPAAVAITANVMPQHVAAYRAAGFVTYAAKPYRATELEDAILLATDHAAAQGGGHSALGAANPDNARVFQPLSASQPRDELS